jgi:hypothetical protein
MANHRVCKTEPTENVGKLPLQPQPSIDIISDVNDKSALIVEPPRSPALDFGAAGHGRATRSRSETYCCTVAMDKLPHLHKRQATMTMLVPFVLAVLQLN